MLGTGGTSHYFHCIHPHDEKGGEQVARHKQTLAQLDTFKDTALFQSSWHVTNILLSQFFIQKVFHNSKSQRFLLIYLEAFSTSRTFGEEEQPVVVVVPHLKVLQCAPGDMLSYRVMSVVSCRSLSRRSHLCVLNQEACLVLSQCQDTEQDPTLTQCLHFH